MSTCFWDIVLFLTIYYLLSHVAWHVTLWAWCVLGKHCQKAAMCIWQCCTSRWENVRAECFEPVSWGLKHSKWSLTYNLLVVPQSILWSTPNSCSGYQNVCLNVHFMPHSTLNININNAEVYVTKCCNLLHLAWQKERHQPALPLYFFFNQLLSYFSVITK